MYNIKKSNAYPDNSWYIEHYINTLFNKFKNKNEHIVHIFYIVKVKYKIKVNKECEKKYGYKFYSYLLSLDKLEKLSFVLPL